MHHHFAAGSLSRHNLVVFVRFSRAVKRCNGARSYLVENKKRAREPPRGGLEPPPRVDQTHASGGRPSWHDGRRGSVREVMGRKCGARSGFPFFFFREPRFPENSEIQQFFKSPFHLQHISETSGKNACTRPAQVTSGYNKVRYGTRQTGLGVIRQIARTGVALGCGREIKRLRHALPWRLLGVARKGTAVVV